jgi:geranylgeranylglycerol-phosphate geranylgeranyltransferase
VATVFIMGGGNALNDYFDVAIDRLNKPHRPLPSGLIERKNALVFSIGLFLAGAGLSLFLNAGAMSIVLINTCLLIIYARYSKAMFLLSNILIAGMTASVFIFSGAILRRIDFNVIVLASSAFWVMMSREILKDIEDMEGDRSAGARTLPLRWGIARARAVSTGLLCPAILLVYGPEVTKAADRPTLGLIILATLFLGFSVFLSPPKAQQVVKLAAVVVLLAFLTGFL